MFLLYIISPSHTRINSFISFKGKCSENNCRATVFGDVVNVPEPGKDVIVSFMALNTLDVYHSKKKDFYDSLNEGLLVKKY